jgi:creatinine amidohydrolase
VPAKRLLPTRASAQTLLERIVVRDRGIGAMTHHEAVEFERMCPEDVLAARQRAAVVFLPVGPLEWHGPHLPLGTDGLAPHHVAVRAALETGGVVLPTMFVGTDSLRPRGREPQGLQALGFSGDERVVGMDFPDFPVKSLYYHETVLGAVIREAVRLLKREPWELIVLLNGHGGPNQKRMLQRIAAEETLPSTAEVLYVQAGVVDEGSDPGHANRSETSKMMALERDLVHVDLLPARDVPLVYREFGVVNGAAFDGHPNEGFAVPDQADPRLSSPEEGQALVDAAVRQLVDLVTDRVAQSASTGAHCTRKQQGTTIGGTTGVDYSQHGVNTSPVQFERMIPEEVLAARKRAAVVFLPVGPLEWHGPHLPLGMDGLAAHHVAVRAARETGGVVLPTMFVGTDSLRPRGREREGLEALGFTGDERVVGMDFPGFPVKSLYYHETVLGAVIREAVRLLKREPWELIVLVNGHGGPNHKRMLQRIAAEETLPSTAEVLYASGAALDETLDPGHADRFEASILMALERDLVHVDRLPARDVPLVYREFGVVNGAAFDGHPNEGFAVPDQADPRLSSPEEGQALVDAAVRQLVDLVTNRMAQAARTAAHATREQQA